MAPLAAARIAIVTADDFGLDSRLNAGILESWRDGLVTAASLVACGEAFEEAADLARAHPALDIGVHLTLDEERPVLTGLRTLVGADGRFHSRNELVARLCTGRISLGEVERCWRAQIQRCVDRGLRPSFLNSHGHVHAFPLLLSIASTLAREFGISAVRRPVERLALRGSPARVTKDALVGWSARCAFAIARPRPRAPSHFAGLRESGALTAERLGCLLGELRPGLTEVMTHPGRVDQTTKKKYGHWGYAWEQELDALLTVRPPSGVMLTTFSKAFGATA
jgi:predicted glycoside hydrolase/deacetylase ChbG (UPF0249 family)